MAEESTTPDLVALTRQCVAAMNCDWDLEAARTPLRAGPEPRCREGGAYFGAATPAFCTDGTAGGLAYGRGGCPRRLPLQADVVESNPQVQPVRLTGLREAS
jgi:hypothetical protein